MKFARDIDDAAELSHIYLLFLLSRRRNEIAIKNYRLTITNIQTTVLFSPRRICIIDRFDC